MRGKDSGVAVFGEVRRITPACAGKRRDRQNGRDPYQDHPRVCGEKTSTATGFRFPTGSPPRVRGKAFGISSKTVARGITPACAGKRSRSNRTRLRPWDHPRVCGEKNYVDYNDCFDWGSPPRVRGKVHKRLYRRIGARITPACAGKSFDPRVSVFAVGDHPRVCGEKKVFSGFGVACQGSPPRVRGKVVFVSFFW